MVVFSIRAVCLPAGTAGLREAPKFVSGLEANEVTPAAGCKGGVTFFLPGHLNVKIIRFFHAARGVMQDLWWRVTGAVRFFSPPWRRVSSPDKVLEAAGWVKRPQ